VLLPAFAAVYPAICIATIGFVIPVTSTVREEVGVLPTVRNVVVPVPVFLQNQQIISELACKVPSAAYISIP
jgi:hypothetical protein